MENNITDLTINESIRILSNNYLGHLAFISKKDPFIIPITYYYYETNNSIICYSAEGHKIKAMRKNTSVSLEVEEIESNSNWQTVLVHGTFEELHGSDAKFYLHQFAQGVKSILTRKEDTLPGVISDFSSKLYSKGIPVVYRIKIVEITGKRKET